MNYLDSDLADGKWHEVCFNLRSSLHRLESDVMAEASVRGSVTAGTAAASS